MKSRRLRFVIVTVIVAICLTNILVYHITYDNPIIIGDSELCEKYRDVCLRYSHTLMEDFFGIPAHAQIINVRKGEGEIVILLTSFFPLSRTKVWHSDGDIPYWEIGLHSY